MSARTALLEAAAALLAPHAAARQVALFPDSPAEFRTRYLKSRSGAWLVGYAGSRRARGGEGAPMREAALDVTVLARRIAGDAGAVADLDLVERLLDGRRLVADGQPYALEYVSDVFVGEEDQVWIYQLRFRCPSL